MAENSENNKQDGDFMSKAVNADREFNIERYAELLAKAQGGRTQTEFAKDCGLSTAYICKHLNKRIDKAPIPSTLKKIAAVAANGVTYGELLDAAGYDASKYISSDFATISTNQEKKHNGLEFEKVATATITTALSKSNLKWSLNGASDSSGYYDLNVEIIGTKSIHWYFNFVTAMTDTGVQTDKSFMDKIFAYYGRLVLLPAGICTKYSFVTDSQSVYDLLITHTPSALAMFVSVILIDISTMSVIKEEYIKSAFAEQTSDIWALIL